MKLVKDKNAQMILFRDLLKKEQIGMITELILEMEVYLKKEKLI